MNLRQFDNDIDLNKKSLTKQL